MINTRVNFGISKADILFLVVIRQIPNWLSSQTRPTLIKDNLLFSLCSTFVIFRENYLNARTNDG